MKTEYESMEQWESEGKRLFGPDQRRWRFVCPACGYVATVQDWVDAGDKKGTMIAFSCIGRLLPECRDALTEDGSGPCNYAGGGLFRLNPVKIKGRENGVFQFAEPVTTNKEKSE